MDETQVRRYNGDLRQRNSKGVEYLADEEVLQRVSCDSSTRPIPTFRSTPVAKHRHVQDTARNERLAPTSIQSFKVSKSVNMGKSQMCRPRPYWVANISLAGIHTRSICCLPAIHTAARATVKTAAQMIRTVIHQLRPLRWSR